MARSPRSTNNATSLTTSRQSTIVPPTFAQPGPSNSQPAPTTRTRSRRPSIATSVTSTTAASTPVPLTPVDTPKYGKAPATESKSHALRSVLGEKERTPCPFPSQYGGSVKCGVYEEDERDDVLMAICSACASIDNRALSADELASIAIEQAWLRPPSAAIAPGTVINNAIRAHLKRCATSEPPRQTLLQKHQLSGAVNESVLESALHPDAFNGAIRPKGTVWHLKTCGKTKWKNPFEGLEIPLPPPRKPAAPVKKGKKEVKAAKESKSKGEKELKPKLKAKTSAHSTSSSSKPSTPPVRIRLLLKPGANREDEDDGGSEAGSSSQGSRNVSRRSSMSRSVTIDGTISGSSQTNGILKPIRQIRNTTEPFLSSDDSDSCDSDMDIDVLPHRSSTANKATKNRKDRPPPLPLATARNATSNMLSRSINSPLVDWPIASVASPIHNNSPLPPPLSSPFPTHSLDNTTWAVRHDPDRFASFEESSSSSDEEMREPGEWGSSSGILIRGSDDAEIDIPIWTAEDEETKVKEATDALRVLFPMSSSQEEDVEREPVVQLNRLDNRTAQSDTSSLAESSSTATASALPGGPLKSADFTASVPLTAWHPSSSPIPSPNLRVYSLAPETSPTQHLSRLHASFEATDMDVDEDNWRDESGELPVKAEDSFSDIDLGSTIEGTPTPEHDRQLHTAAWAREAAASTSYRVKEEPQDYPSPFTESDEVAAEYRTSRASSSDSHTPSSRSSELPSFDMDADNLGLEFEEIFMGPESVTLEELEGWCMEGKPQKTPQRNGRHGKSRHQRSKTDPHKCSGSWGTIGVGTALAALTSHVSPAARSKPTRIGLRRRQSSTQTIQTIKLPATDESEDVKISEDYAECTTAEPIEIDGISDDGVCIGPAELEEAKAEAEAREEAHRLARREKAAKHQALLEAFKRQIQEERSSSAQRGTMSPDGDEPTSPWLDLAGTAWGSSSTESINLTTPTPSAVPPAFLHNTSGILSPEGLLPTSLDPKTLLSPPLIPGGINMMDDVLSQAEVEAVISTTSPTPPILSPGPIDTAKPATKAAAANANGATNAKESKAAAAKVKEEKKTVIVDLPTSLPADAAPASTAPAKKTAPRTIQAKEGRVVKVPATAQKEIQATLALPKVHRGIIKPLCAGVDACVVDNIPVYCHVFQLKNGKNSVVLRRLDTDFVNGSCLLSALHVPVSKHAEYLNAPSPWLHSHHPLTSPTPDGSMYSPGVAGTWIQLAEARDLAKRFKLNQSSLLANVLKEDLFLLFATLAALRKDNHHPSEVFGLPFNPQPPDDDKHPKPTSTLSNSSANSKSTPNLSALSTSAPAKTIAKPSPHTPVAPGPATAVKGSLVRSAPVTPPDGCPHPKRRRATVVGDMSPLSKVALTATAPAKDVSSTLSVSSGNTSPLSSASETKSNNSVPTTNPTANNGKVTATVPTATPRTVQNANAKSTGTAATAIGIANVATPKAVERVSAPATPTTAATNIQASGVKTKSTTVTPQAAIRKVPPRAAKPSIPGTPSLRVAATK